MKNKTILLLVAVFLVAGSQAFAQKNRKKVVIFESLKVTRKNRNDFKIAISIFLVRADQRRSTRFTLDLRNMVWTLHE